MFKVLLAELTFWRGDGFGAVRPNRQEHPSNKQQLVGDSFPSGQLRHEGLSWTNDFLSPGKVLKTHWLLSGLRCADLINSHGAYIGLGFTQRAHFHPKGTFLPEASWSRACLPYGAARSSWQEGCGELPQFHLCNFFSKVRRSRGRRNREGTFAGLLLLPCWKGQMLRMETHNTSYFQEIIWASAPHCA